MVMDATFGIAPEYTISHIQSLVEQHPDVKLSFYGLEQIKEDKVF